MFPEETLYGWGVFGISMPRAVNIHNTDRRKMAIRIPFLSRRKSVSKPFSYSSVSRIFIYDLQWGQALFLTFLSALIITSIYVFNNPLRIKKSEQLSKPVDIVISFINETQVEKRSPPEEKPLPRDHNDHVEQKVVTKPATDEPQNIMIIKSNREKQQVSREKQRSVLQEPLRDIEMKSRISHNLLEEQQTISPSILHKKTHPEEEKFAIAPSTLHHRNYIRKDANRFIQRTESNALTNFVSKNNESINSTIHAEHLRRNYESVVSKPDKPRMTEQMPSSDLFALNRKAQTAEAALPDGEKSDSRYALEERGSGHPMRGAHLVTDQQIAFQSRKTDENIKLQPQKQFKNFSTRSHQRHNSPKASLGATGFLTFQHQTPVIDDVPSNKSRTDGAYVYTERKRHQSQIPKSKNQEFSARPPNLSGGVNPVEIDASKLISLLEFNVCEDPEKEFFLKTQLAIHLDRPSWLVAEELMFFCKYPQSGYTIQVEIYNPNGHHFRDRCEILEYAVNAIFKSTK